MYNRLYKYLSNQKILHPQQFGLRKSHSTEHVIAQLVDQIYESFENDNKPLAFSSTCQRRLIQSILQYFWKSFRSMELRGQIFLGLEVN